MLTYKRGKNALGETQYVAETKTHRYYVRQDSDRRPRDGKWIVVIWTLTTVGTVHPVTIADKLVETLDYHYSRAPAYADAQAHADKHAA